MRVADAITKTSPLAAGILLLASTTLAGRTQSQVCSVQNMSVSVEGSGIPLSFANAAYVTTEEGPVFTKIEVTNNSGSQIRGLAFVVEYLGRGEHSSIQVSFVAEKEGLKENYAWPFHAEYRDNSFSTPLDSGHARIVQGMSTSILPDCPTTARLTYLGVLFSDDTVRSWASPHWRLGAILDYFPGDPASNPTVKIPSYELILATVSSQGKVVRLESIGPNTTADMRETSHQLELERWGFFPAVREGALVEAQVAIVVEFLPDATTHVAVDYESIKYPYLVMKIFPSQRISGGWRIWCEWREGDSHLQ